jgi:hypothetical protein
VLAGCIAAVRLVRRPVLLMLLGCHGQSFWWECVEITLT